MTVSSSRTRGLPPSVSNLVIPPWQLNLVIANSYLDFVTPSGEAVRNLVWCARQDVAREHAQGAGHRRGRLADESNLDDPGIPVSE
jgi:hypothetical protein